MFQFPKTAAQAIAMIRSSNAKPVPSIGTDGRPIEQMRPNTDGVMAGTGYFRKTMPLGVLLEDFSRQFTLGVFEFWQNADGDILDHAFTPFVSRAMTASQAPDLWAQVASLTLTDKYAVLGWVMAQDDMDAALCAAQLKAQVGTAAAALDALASFAAAVTRKDPPTLQTGVVAGDAKPSATWGILRRQVANELRAANPQGTQSLAAQRFAAAQGILDTAQAAYTAAFQRAQSTAFALKKVVPPECPAELAACKEAKIAAFSASDAHAKAQAESARAPMTFSLAKANLTMHMRMMAAIVRAGASDPVQVAQQQELIDTATAAVPAAEAAVPALAKAYADTTLALSAANEAYHAAQRAVQAAQAAAKAGAIKAAQDDHAAAMAALAVPEMGLAVAQAMLANEQAFATLVEV